MAIVSGVNIPDNKRVETALTSIYGIGPSQSKDVLDKAGLFDNPRVRDLSDEDLNRIREIIDKDKSVFSLFSTQLSGQEPTDDRKFPHVSRILKFKSLRCNFLEKKTHRLLTDLILSSDFFSTSR